ncbi:MAG: response regulator [Chitinivibrionales bacterium]|nr:response regulator [Chitinivibrionales bacterium]MBD3356938.1 response regulator [Chitinivibrionales bacterium]
MKNGKIGAVLIVDDEAIIRGMLEIELESKYIVYSAENAAQAFEILSQHHVDLVISDINMPGMKGYELLRKVKESYPNIKTALITAYNIDDYVRMAKANDISNIIPKSTPFNFDEFNSIVHNLVTEQIFGLPRYLLPDHELIKEYDIAESSQINDVEEEILALITKFHKPQPFVQILLEELITNAVYHAPVLENGLEKYRKHSDVRLDDSEIVHLVLGRDGEKYGVSVLDTSGKLTKEQVLYRMDRHIHGEGLLDEDGRGLHMSRMYSDRLIINIKKNAMTEAIFLNYLNEKYKGFKPLYINEV